MAKKLLSVFVVLVLLLSTSVALAEEGYSYPPVTADISEPTSEVYSGRQASVNAYGGSGSFSYQWYCASSAKTDGTISSPAKGKAISGETQSSFSGVVTASLAGKYLYCRVTDSVTGEKQYTRGRKMFMTPPMYDGSAQGVTICYDTLKLVISGDDSAADKFGKAIADGKKAYIGQEQAKSASYSSGSNTLKLVFKSDISKMSQPIQLRLAPKGYKELNLTISGVTPLKEEVTISKGEVSLIIGNAVTLTAKPSAAEWASSNPSVATVSAKGVVTGVGMGTATITVTSKKGGTATCNVTVSDTPKPATISGSGSVTLQLGSNSKAACYKLYAANKTSGTPLRQAYVPANTSGSMSFDPGTYVLKIAMGKTWLGDDQAFGKSGSYSKSDAYTFESGSYSITVSTTHGDFRGSSQSGFVG